MQSVTGNMQRTDMFQRIWLKYYMQWWPHDYWFKVHQILQQVEIIMIMFCRWLVLIADSSCLNSSRSQLLWISRPGFRPQEIICEIWTATSHVTMTSFPVSLSGEEMSNSPKPRYLQFKWSLKRLRNALSSVYYSYPRVTKTTRNTKQTCDGVAIYLGGNHLLN